MAQKLRNKDSIRVTETLRGIMEEGLSGFYIRAECVRSNNNGTSGSSSGTKCGRWNPTSEQVKLLTELFRAGLRTPSTDQIQKISTQLSFYGKIESKNVFYWFQNHKARERQKRRKVSFDDVNKDVIIRREKTTAIPSAENYAEINQVCEPERVFETLELFPLNSFCESESERLRVQANDQCRETKIFSYTMGEHTDHPPLDLRLSSV